MSYCSSPISQRSSFSCTFSPGCNSPSTAATTPSNSGDLSPKIEQLQSYTYNQLPSPNVQELNYTYNYSPSLNEVPYGYVPPQVSSPTSTYLQPQSPGQNSYQPYDYSYQQQQSPLSPPPVVRSSTPKYSGYPPASAFYGPTPTPPTTSSLQSTSHQPHYRRRNSERKTPEEYTFETWYTSDGRKVEYSPMHLNCATM